jgi:hypothetical protein
MKYMLIFHETPEDFAARTDPAKAPAYWSSWKSYGDAIGASGALTGGGALHPPSTGTSVRVRGESRQVQDGPFASAKEQLAGFMLIDVADLDAALDWAARAPCAATGGVEVRPLLEMGA